MTVSAQALPGTLMAKGVKQGDHQLARILSDLSRAGEGLQ